MSSTMSNDIYQMNGYKDRNDYLRIRLLKELSPLGADL